MLFSISDIQNRFCKIPCTLQFEGPKLIFSSLPLHGLPSLADCARVFSGQQWLILREGACELSGDAGGCHFPSRSSHPVVRVVESERASFCAEVTSLAHCSFIWDVFVCTLTVSPTRPISLSVRHLSVPLRSRDRKLIKGGQTVTRNYTQRRGSHHFGTDALSHGIHSLKS